MSETKNVGRKDSDSTTERWKFWLPWVLTVVASTIAIVQFVSSTSDYRISYLLESSEQMVSSTPEYTFDFLVNDQVIVVRDGLRVQSLTVWNSGRKPLLEQQLREPMSVNFVGCAPLALKLVGQNSLGENDATLDYSGLNNETDKVVIRSKNFDPGEAYKFVFIANCEAKDIRVSVVSPIAMNIEKQPSNFKVAFSILVFAFMFAAAFGILGVLFSIIDNSRFFKERKRLNDLAHFAGIGLSFTLFGLAIVYLLPLLMNPLFWVPLKNLGPI